MSGKGTLALLRRPLRRTSMPLAPCRTTALYSPIIAVFALGRRTFVSLGLAPPNDTSVSQALSSPFLVRPCTGLTETSSFCSTRPSLVTLLATAMLVTFPAFYASIPCDTPLFPLAFSRTSRPYRALSTRRMCTSALCAGYAMLSTRRVVCRHQALLPSRTFWPLAPRVFAS